ncbi:hypothetical protein [Micromonospora sp. NPDC048063]
MNELIDTTIAAPGSGGGNTSGSQSNTGGNAGTHPTGAGGTRPKAA